MVQNAFLRYAIRIVAYDEVYTNTVDGREETQTDPQRIIYGDIQNTNDKNVTLDFDGAISDGAMMIHTKDKLYFADVNNKNNSDNRQTFVIYGGETWKVAGSKFWSGYSYGINKYILIKYTETTNIY